MNPVLISVLLIDETKPTKEYKREWRCGGCKMKLGRSIEKGNKTNKGVSNY